MIVSINMKNKLSFRLRLAAVHLMVSAVIAILVAMLVFFVWYPSPYGYLTGGLKLFLLVIAVDLVCGPLFTLILANSKKSKRELMLDLSLVVLIQLGALGYGLYSVKLARPVVISFERDRMAVVTETEIDLNSLSQAPEGMRKLPLTGMMKIGIRRAQNEQEFFESVNLAMNGVEPSLRPNWWIPYQQVLPEVRDKMLPLSAIAWERLDETKRQRLEQAVSATQLPQEKLYYLPLVSKYTQDWIVLLNPEADFVGYVNVNGFELKDND